MLKYHDWMACWARLGASCSPSALLKGCGAMMKLEKDGGEGFGGRGGRSGSDLENCSWSVGIVLGESSGGWLIVLGEGSISLLESILGDFSSSRNSNCSCWDSTREGRRAALAGLGREALWLSILFFDTFGTSDIDFRAGRDTGSSWVSSSLLSTGIELALMRWRSSASLA